MAHKLWEQLDEWKTTCEWVELSHPMSPSTPHWVGFEALKEETFLSLDEAIFAVHTYTTVGQYGTHVDGPSHMVKGMRTLETCTPAEMVLPLCVIDKTAEVAANPDFIMQVADIEGWEAVHGRIPEGAMVAFQSGWGKRGGDLDNNDAEGNRHFPGWALEAVEFLVKQRNVGSIGHETSDTESPLTSGKTNYEVEKYILGQDRIQFELLTNLESCPPTGALFFGTFPRVVGGSGFPARCFALCPKN